MSRPLNIPENIGDYVSYDFETGLMKWIKKTSKHSHVKVGEAVGRLDSKGYRQMQFMGTNYLNHRVAWFLHTGEQPPEQIDHVDTDPTNNRFSNFRAADYAGNVHNRGKSSTNTSGYKGVNWNKGAGKWLAAIQSNHTRHHLGLFNNPEEAHQAYCKAADELHKEFKNYG